MVPIDGPKAEIAYRRLKDLLRHGGFRPGEHLPPAVLAPRLGVGAMPLREALTRLQGEGWVTLRSRKGFCAPVPRVADQVDRYRLAALILDHALVVAPTPDLAEMARATSPGGSATAEALVTRIEAVLVGVAAGAANGAMQAAIADFVDRSHHVRRLDLEDPASRSHSAAVLAALAGFLAANDRAAARGGMQALLDAQVVRMAELVTQALARPLLRP